MAVSTTGSAGRRRAFRTWLATVFTPVARADRARLKDVPETLRDDLACAADRHPVQPKEAFWAKIRAARLPPL